MAKYIPDFRAGDTYRLKLKYPAGTVLTGYRHWLTLRGEFEVEDSIVLEVDSVFGVHPSDALNVAYVEATPEQTASIPAGKYYYDVQAKSATGEVVTLAPPPAEYKDKVLVAPQVTVGM